MFGGFPPLPTGRKGFHSATRPHFPFRSFNGVAAGAVVFVLNLALPGLGQSPPLQRGVGPPDELVPRQYCGLNSLFLLLRLWDQPVELTAWLGRSDFLNAPEGGSTFDDLKRAAAEHGLGTHAVKGLTVHHLRRAKLPVILHTRRDPDSGDFHHFEVFIGRRGEEARIYDAPALKWESFASLARRWDGTGLIVSPTEIDPAAITGPGVHWGVFGLIGGVAGLVLLARAWERRHRPPSPRTFSQFFGGSGRAGRLCHDGGLEAATKRLAPRPVSRST